ncbi:CBFA2T1 isoform X3 [Brachionus plicatilis]|uniref:CBFA2T1 isoform X3 n=1 Tax=Brachionus plicatilis TaxID=10195 RepID=A0A3M7PWX5_BRAPC|nr:CBFA2T1 isoform X3 [Brachionus plicatilis]
MLGNSLNELSKFYNGNSLSHKPLRVSHLEKGENSSERICHSSGSSNLHHKNLNEKKIDMPCAKQSNDDNNTKVPSGHNFLNNSHQSKKILDTLNDKNMCHYIFQQHLNLKSQTPYEKVDSKPKDKSTIKASTSDQKHRENLYRTHSPYQYSHLLSKSSTEPTFQMKMPPPLHSNMPQLHSPPGSFGAKQLSKLKRFLTTLQQFAVDISPETGERVRGLVLNLVNSVISIEEFHSKLQEATNFPLRPFVIPFLRANLPLLQYELLNFTRLSKLNASDYLNQSVENYLFNECSPQNNPSPTHYSDTLNNKYKRKTPDNETIAPPPNKKMAQNLPLLYISSPNSHLSGPVQNQGLAAPPPIRPRPSPPHQHNPQFPIQPPPVGLLMPNQMNGKNSSKHEDHFLRGKDKNFNNYMKEFEQDFNEALNMDAVNIDFKNIDSMLNSIFEMVEKTQKILDTVQSKAQKLKKQKEFYENELKRVSEPTNGQVNTNESKKKSNEVISSKNDQRTSEHLGKDEKCDGHLKESNQDEENSEKCWNCGRRGVETCSKCTQTKFCSHFCKNKHFEVKHYKQFDLENVKSEKLDEKENDIGNDLLSDDILMEKQTKHSNEDEKDTKNCKAQNENKKDE